MVTGIVPDRPGRGGNSQRPASVAWTMTHVSRCWTAGSPHDTKSSTPTNVSTGLRLRSLTQLNEEVL
jgi:hypothetical protein